MDATGGNVKKPSRLWDRVRGLGRAGLDQLYPPVCVNCSLPLAEPDGLCAACWRRMRPITAPLCPVLGLPFDYDPGPGIRSPAAIADPPPFDRARSAFVYDDIPRRIVTRLKYGDRPELARFCARTLFAAAAELLTPDAVLVPVPLYRWRQFSRRYNQSTELARALAAMAGLEMVPSLVRRKRRTAQQVGLSAGQRARNVQGAFAVDAAQMVLFAGRRLVLVDDVITTGATVAALTRTLKRAGFSQIDVISFARVVI